MVMHRSTPARVSHRLPRLCPGHDVHISSAQGISEGARDLFTIGCGEGEESSNEPWQHGAMKWFGGPAHMRVEDYAVLQRWFRCDFSKRTLSLLAL